MDETLLIEAAAIRRLLAAGEPIRVLDVRGSAAHRSSSERIADDVRVTAREVGEVTERLERPAWILAYCT